ncbi:MAG: IS1182 family transposase [Acetobacteraceae bacterium]|nr:IS1182 family transposase [Acetobacteraceae bacterium]
MDRDARPRLHSPDRQQLLSSRTIDELLEADHPARAVWSYVEGLDLAPLYDRIRARGSVAGRPAIDPRLLVALWLYATLSGVSSARELADLCLRHDAFRWLAGGVSVNYHTLADFRTDHLEFTEQLLTQSVEVLRQQDRIDLDRIAPDGMRVRASAGAASFRRRETLERLLQEAQAEVQRLQQKLAATAADPPAPQQVVTERASASEPPSPRQAAAALHHAEDRLERIEQALERMPELEAKIKPDDDKEARVSTTDPKATVMKMADGGYRPAYNIEYATACRGQVIVGVDVVTQGSDQGQLPPMLDQIENRFGVRPKEVLVDGGVVNLKDIAHVQGEKECTVYAPVAKPKKEGVDRHVPKATDSEEVAEWRKRMGTPEAKEIYKERAATSECVNAQARNRGLQQLTVRGIEKVKSIASWFAIVHNMARSFALQPQPG